MGGMNMLEEIKKSILVKKAKTFTDVIDGFTRQLEESLQLRNPSGDKIDVSSLMSMPTYQFAIMAFENNSPTQVVKVIKEIKKRYSKKKNIDSLTLGFLDALEGKAYGYIALYSKNAKYSETFYKCAIKCFENAYSRGYCDALLDLADLQKKLINPFKGEETAFRVLAESNESYTRLGEMFYDFNSLVESAIRVLEGRRTIISDIVDFKYAMWKYQDGASKSINSKFYYGLSLIIYNEDNSLEKGLKIVKETFSEFKKVNENYSKMFFSSDVKKFKENIDLIEKKIIKVHKR